MKTEKLLAFPLIDSHMRGMWPVTLCSARKQTWPLRSAEDNPRILSSGHKSVSKAWPLTLLWLLSTVWKTFREKVSKYGEWLFYCLCRAAASSAKPTAFVRNVKNFDDWFDTGEAWPELTLTKRVREACQPPPTATSGHNVRIQALAALPAELLGNGGGTMAHSAKQFASCTLGVCDSTVGIERAGQGGGAGAGVPSMNSVTWNLGHPSYFLTCYRANQ